MKDFICLEKLQEMQFKYDVTEFSTSIKPFVLKYLLQKYCLAVYLDPDIFFYSKIKDLQKKDKSIFLTPHIVFPYTKWKSPLHDYGILWSGIFNCGFVAFKNTKPALDFLDFWGGRLLDHCFCDIRHALFTDQKWMDFASGFFLEDAICVIFDLGCNVAPWNYHERLIFKEKDTYKVKPLDNEKENKIYDLCFMHFSGFDYKKLCNGIVEHKSFEQVETKDIIPSYALPLIKAYGLSLKKNLALDFFDIPYKYNFYDTGLPVTMAHRRLFRGLLECKNPISSICSLSSPFSSQGDFYRMMKKSKLLLKSGGKMPKPTDVKNFSLKERLLFLFFKIAFFFLGAKSYEQFLGALRKYSCFENQLFLLKTIQAQDRQTDRQTVKLYAQNNFVKYFTLKNEDIFAKRRCA